LQGTCAAAATHNATVKCIAELNRMLLEVRSQPGREVLLLLLLC
jgi:hypothetical protein